MSGYPAEVVNIAHKFEIKGWTAYHRFTADRRHWSACPSCGADLHHAESLGLGLAYCKRCKIALGLGMRNTLVGGGVQKWAYVYKASLYEIVHQHLEPMRQLSGQI